MRFPISSANYAPFYAPFYAADTEGASGSAGDGDTTTPPDDDGSLLDRAAKKANGEADTGDTAGDEKVTLQTDRPEWMPEQFWDPDKGEARTESMAKAWKDTRQALDDAKAKKGAPEKAEGYLDGWEQPKTEDGADLARTKPVAADDPALSVVAEAAHEIGMSKKDFDKFVRKVMVGFDGLLPEPVDEAAEIAALGGEEAADKVIKGVAGWGVRMFEAGDWNEAEFNAWRGLNRTAAGVSLAAKMMQMGGEKPVPLNLEQDGVKSEVELEGMMKDPRYKTDPAYRAQVQKEYSRRYGAKPTAPGSTHSPAFTD